MHKRTVLSDILAIVTLCATAVEASAQDREATIGFTQIVTAGDGVDRTCFEDGSRSQITGRITLPLLKRRALVAITARRPVLRRESTCVSSPLPLNATVFTNDRANLLSEPYTATDIRLGAHLGSPTNATRLSVGVGNVWRPGQDAPYVLGAFQIFVRPLQWLHVTVEAEYDRLRIVNRPVQRTYENGRVVSVIDLGSGHSWKQATSLALAIGLQW